MENELYAGLVRQPTKEGGAYAAQAEHQAEEHAGYHAHLVGLEVGGVDHDGREGRGDNQAGKDGHQNRERQVEIRHQHGERRGAKYGEEDDILAPIPVAQETSEERAGREGGEIAEEAELRLLHGDVEALDEEEREIAGHTGVEEILGEYQHHQYPQRPTHLPPREVADGGLAGLLYPPPLRQHGAVPSAYPHQYQGCQQGRRGKPPHGALAMGQHDDGRQERPDGAAAVAAHLEDGLRQALASARGHLRHAGSLGMEHRGAASYQGHGEQDGIEMVGESQGQEPRQREAHAQGKGIGPRVAVGVKPYEGLEDGGGHLEHQRDDTYLGEREPQVVLDDGIHGRDDGLHHVVEQMAKAYGEQYGEGRLRLHVGVSLQFLYDSHVCVFASVSAHAAGGSRARR